MRWPAATTGATGDVVTMPNPAVLTRRPSARPIPRERRGVRRPRDPAQRLVRDRAVTLLERAGQLELLAACEADVRARSRGRFVLVAGEAGIGKTALVRAFCEGRPRGAVGRLRRALHATPAWPAARHRRGGRAGRSPPWSPRARRPATLVAALAAELRARSPTIVVLEDLHWADEATLDVVRLLARRIESLPALVIATYRDDELGPRAPAADGARRAAEPRRRPRRAGAALARSGGDARGRERRPRRAAPRARAATPFFVTEALAAGGDRRSRRRSATPCWRALRALDPGARRCSTPSRSFPCASRLWLLEALPRRPTTRPSALDACLASGMLRADRDAIAFRHEIARVAVEEALAAARASAAAPPRAGRARRLGQSRPGAARPPRRGGRTTPTAVLRYAPAAGERAAKLGSHREAAAQFARALRYAPSGRADLLERLLIRVLPDRPHRRSDRGPRAGAREHCVVDDRCARATRTAGSRACVWFSGDNAQRRARRSRWPSSCWSRSSPGPELAMAYSNLGQLRMLARDAARG